MPDAKGNVRAVCKGDAWLDSPYRRQYDDEVFAPGREVPSNILNLYRGLAITPRRGGWVRFRAHLLETICSGDGAAFEYLVRWMARMFQRPGEPGQVAIALRGDEGAGKGFLGRELGRALGQHGIHISSSRHLVGNFNAHLANKVYCFADEAFFAGDPEARGGLYALITENRMQIESKGGDVRTVANNLHVLMATNEDWAIPAGVNSRRFLVLDVSSKHRQDAAYFKAITAELAAGGLEAMVYDLLEMNLSNFDVLAVHRRRHLQHRRP